MKFFSKNIFSAQKMLVSSHTFLSSFCKRNYEIKFACQNSLNLFEKLNQ